MVEHVYVEFADPSCISFCAIPQKNKCRWKPYPRVDKYSQKLTTQRLPFSSANCLASSNVTSRWASKSLLLPTKKITFTSNVHQQIKHQETTVTAVNADRKVGQCLKASSSQTSPWSALELQQPKCKITSVVRTSPPQCHWWSLEFCNANHFHSTFIHSSKITAIILADVKPKQI